MYLSQQKFQMGGNIYAQFKTKDCFADQLKNFDSFQRDLTVLTCTVFLVLSLEQGNLFH